MLANRWKRTVGAALLALVFAVPAQATNVIRVMTFNLRYASATNDGANSWTNLTDAPERRQVVVSVMTNRAPDLVGFQEGEDAQLDYLQQYCPGYAFERRKPSGGSGQENASFAWKTNRLDLLDRGVFSLGPAPGGSYWNNNPATNFDPYLFFPAMGLIFRASRYGAASSGNQPARSSFSTPPTSISMMSRRCAAPT